MRKIPSGKIMFIWQIAECYSQSAPMATAELAKHSGLDGVAIKITDGTTPYGRKNQQELLPPLVDQLKEKGIAVYGWGYIYGKTWYGKSIAEAEAEVAIDETTKYGMDAFFIDAEHEYKAKGMAVNARNYMSTLRAGLPDTALGLCSYRYPQWHHIPWTAFLNHCDFHAPQVYWEQAHNPASQLSGSMEALRALKNLPFVPVGSAYARGEWIPTEEDINRFYGQAVVNKCNGVAWWSWQHAERNGLWDAVTGYDWEGNGQEPITLESLDKRVKTLEKKHNLI